MSPRSVTAAVISASAASAVVNVSPTFHLPQFQLVADEAAFQIQTVAGEDRTPEADLFEPGEEEELPGGLARIETMQHQQAASLRQASMISTPGITGTPGNAPEKNSSLKLTHLCALMYSPSTISLTLSTSRNG